MLYGILKRQTTQTKMTAIRKNIEFTVQDTSNLKEKTIEYFTKSCFKHIDNLSDRKLKFRRGSIASNMWTFNPLKWKSEIDIEINGRVVKATFAINASGQIPTQKEENLWDTFIENYEKYLSVRYFDFVTKNDKALITTKNNSLKYVAWAALGGIIGGIPAGLVAYWTEIHSIASIGAAGGAIALLTKKINDGKKKNAL
jgi:hypothetical protein